MAALESYGSGGLKPTYTATTREQSLAEAQRALNPQQDGTANWSLMTLRKAPDGLPQVSSWTIGQVLHRRLSLADGEQLV